MYKARSRSALWESLYVTFSIGAAREAIAKPVLQVIPTF